MRTHMADKHTSLLSLERRIRGDPGSVGLSATWQVRSPSHWMFPREQRHTATEDLLRFNYARNRSRQKEEVSRYSDFDAAIYLLILPLIYRFVRQSHFSLHSVRSEELTALYEYLPSEITARCLFKTFLPNRLTVTGT